VNIVAGVILGFVLVVVQTACFPHFFISCRCYDLLLPLVVYLGVFRPVAESMFLAAFFGVIMDCVSGTPFGLYFITYVWILLGVRGSMRLLDAGSYFLFPLILSAGLLLEHLLFAFSISRLPSAQALLSALWAIATAPFFLIFFKGVFGRLGRIVSRLDFDRQG
jgi:cell shape-determining protein MreD